MTATALLAHVALSAVLPILLTGVINRVKSVWAGRKGVPLLQSFYDLRRLLRKEPVYSTVATQVVRTAPYVALGTGVVSVLLVPIIGPAGPLSFSLDFVFLAYVWGLGRMALILGALDTGSSFEGMGASREATYAALIEPAFFLALGTLLAATGKTAIVDLLRLRPSDPAAWAAWIGCVAALFIFMQVESARIPVDDPNTHLELTMIHEVMILDHSGPDLAALQYASALKMTACAALLAGLLNPVDPAATPAAFAAASAGLILGVGLVVGTVESLIARLRLRALPEYVFAAVAAAFVALLAGAWRIGAGG